MSSESAIHRAEVVRPDWVQSRQSFHQGGLTAEHQVHPIGECETSKGLPYHVLVFELGSVSRQVMRLDSQEYDSSLARGNFFLIPAGAPFFGACESADEVLAFIIKPTFLESLALAVNPTQPERVELIGTFKRRDQQIEEIVHCFQRETQIENWGNRLYLESLTNLLAIHLLRNYSSRIPKPSKLKRGLSELKLSQVLDYIDANLDQEIRLADLAQVVNLNPCYFSSLFKLSTGISPWRYITQRRLERAKKLLKHHHCSISAIAVQCGFSSQSHLTHQFRKMTGTTPNEYRQRL